MTQKVQVSSDALYQYLTEHGVTISRLSELMGVSFATVNSCFLHHKMMDGTPRRFTAKNIEKLNIALEQMAEGIRGAVLTFGSDRVFTNRRGKTYDPALVEPIKNNVAKYFSMNLLCEKVLGWSRPMKRNVLESNTGKAFGCITADDVNRINAELLSVAGVLGSYEVVPDDSSSDSSC